MTITIKKEVETISSFVLSIEIKKGITLQKDYYNQKYPMDRARLKRWRIHFKKSFQRILHEQ